MLQYRCTQTLAVDIHPAAKIGKGVLLDHGTGLVIGETAVVGNNVSILHNVTLGGVRSIMKLRKRLQQPLCCLNALQICLYTTACHTVHCSCVHYRRNPCCTAGTGKEVGDRHPKVNDNVLIGASATILGNISIGKGAQVAAGSLVLKNVPPRTMVAGSPAKEVGKVTGGLRHLLHLLTKDVVDQRCRWEPGRVSRANDCLVILFMPLVNATPPSPSPPSPRAPPRGPPPPVSLPPFLFRRALAPCTEDMRDKMMAVIRA